MAMATRRREWSVLPLDLLGAIFNCLPLPDRLRVGAVCRGWSVASAESPYRPTNPQPPWLVGGTCADVYSLSEHRLYRFRSIPATSAKCTASSHGWLFFSYQPPDRRQLLLLNPITGVTIDLPSPATLPFPNIVRPSLFRSSYYFKVKLFSSSSSGRHKNDIMVFVSSCSGIGAEMQNRMAYANAGDRAWTPIAAPHSFRGMADFAFHKGELYGVFDNSDGALVVIMDIKNPTSPPRYIYPRWQDSFKALRLSTRMAYHLMDSTVDGEDLLLVLSTALPFFYRCYFWVMKLDSEAQLWLPLPRLKDQTAIFLGGNRSMALSTRALPELKENCIYFTRYQCHIGGPLDEGIFDLQDGSISPLFPRHYWSTSPLHMWFTPAL